MAKSALLERSKLPPEQKAVARRLRAAREQGRFSGAELAVEAGITKSALQHYETGAAALPFAIGDTLLKRMDYNQYWLAFGGEITRPWLDLSAFPVDASTLEQARSRSFLDACSGPLKPVLDDWLATHPMELIIEQSVKAGVGPALKRMSRSRLGMFLADAFSALRKTDDAMHRKWLIGLLRDGLDQFAEITSRQIRVDSRSNLVPNSPVRIAEQLKQVRKKLGLSQSRAAARWSVPLSTWKKWESGRNAPRGLGLRQLEMILRNESQPSG